MSPETDNANTVGEPAFYSLVRYVADEERDEPVNIGVLVETRTGETFGRFFEREELRAYQDSIRRFESLVGRLIGERSLEDPEESTTTTSLLSALAVRRFPHFRISDPRQISLEGDPSAAVEKLVGRLVDTSSYSIR